MELFSKIQLAFQHGGIWMYPIMMFQMVSIAITVERVHALYIKRKATQVGFVAQFEDSIKRGDIESVIAKAQGLITIAPVSAAIIAGAQAAVNFGGKEEIQGKMDEVLIAENSVLDKRVGFLAMLGNVATLTGLLGTITGMIKSFAAVGQAQASEKATILAAGISEAMNATAYGLIAAIPALLMYAILQNRANHLADDLNQAALKVFNWLSYSYEPIVARPVKNRRAQRDAELNA